MIKAVIMDFDGVILESVDVKGQAFRDVFQDYPQYQNAILEYHYANGGVSRYEKFKYIYREIFKAPLSDEKFEDLCRCFAGLVVRRVLEAAFVPGAHEFLKRYYRKTALFIVSGTPDEEIKAIVQARGLDHFFKGVYGSPESKGEWTRHILEQGPYCAQEVLWVGDALSDWQAARDHQIRFLGRVVPGNDIFADRSLERKIHTIDELGQYMEENA